MKTHATPETIFALLARYAPLIDGYIRCELERVDPFSQEIIAYHFGWLDEGFEPTGGRSGKRFRSALCLLTYESLQGEVQPCLPLAASIEMIHNFSLIHDDVEDGDEQRRGYATVWKVWGKPLAVNTGDLLLALAYMPLFKLPQTQFSAPKVLEVIGMISETVATLCQGQQMDLMYEAKMDVTVQEYLSMVGAKTASLIEASVTTAAMLASDNPEIVNHYRTFARNLGFAFQIRDDMFGLWGDPEKTGKPKGSDIVRKKKTLPVIYGLMQATGKEQQRLIHLYSQPQIQQGDVEEVLRIFSVMGAYEYTQQVLDRYIGQAMQQLTALKQIAGKDQSGLFEVTSFLASRNH